MICLGADHEYQEDGHWMWETRLRVKVGECSASVQPACAVLTDWLLFMLSELDAASALFCQALLTGSVTVDSDPCSFTKSVFTES